MALALAPAEDASLGAVFEEAGQRLEAAKSADKDCIWLLGRTLEWKQFAEAAELKDSLMRMVADFGCSPQYLRDLCGIYRETQSKMSRRQARRMGGERPWRYHRRIRRILGAARPYGGPARGDYSESTGGVDRGPDRTQRRYRQVAARRPRGARMGEAVRRSLRNIVNG